MDGPGEDISPADTSPTDTTNECSALSDEVRYQTLSQLEGLLRLLVERYGARMTLGEILAITAAMALWCKQDQVSIGEIAEVTGLPKQNVSRWAQKRIGDTISLKVNDDDQRMHDVVMLDRQRAGDHIERLAKLLGIDGPG